MRLSIVILLCLAALGTPALAKKPTLVVVDLVPAARTKGVDPALVQFAARLTAQLRTRAAAAYTLVPSKDADGTAAWFCLDKKPACWASIGAEAKADWMIYGKVEKVGDRFHVLVKLHEVSSKDHAKAAISEVVSATTIGDPTAALGKQLYAKLHGQAPQTRAKQSARPTLLD